MNTYDDLCTEEQALAKAGRHGHKAATVAVVLHPRKFLRSGNIYHIRRWGVFEGGAMIATIHQRRDGKLLWDTFMSSGVVVEVLDV